jgi:hypothetical protein
MNGSISKFVFLVSLSLIALLLGGCSAERDEPVIEKRIVLPDTSGITVFELLDVYHEVEYRETSSGILVLSIDSIPNTGTAFWLYFVNDSSGPVASDRYILRGGEKVEWRFISGY